MCGRYTLRRLDVLRAVFEAAPSPDFEEFDERPRFNIAPSQHVPVVLLRDDRRTLAAMKWGLIPSWTKGKPKLQPINARCESVRTSPMFRTAIDRQRCLIPVDGFYEWQGKKPPKQPYFFHRPDDAPFAFAGIWEHWKPDDAEPVMTCCIITTTPNDVMRPVHDRMPMILAPADYAAWMDEKTPGHHVKALMRPAPDDTLETWKISTAVNNVRNDGEELIVPLAPPASNSA